MNDIRFALRQLRKSPGFTLVAVVTLALGIGLNTAIFSLIHDLFLRRLPFHEPERVVRIYGEAVMQLLKELHQSGATICMVTHDERFAQHADRTVHLFDGRVVEDRIAA